MLLINVLQEISDADYISKSSIAKRLNKDVALVDDAMVQLINLGYLREYDFGNCDLPCSGCAYASLCNNKTSFKTILITEKGKNLLTKRLSQLRRAPKTPNANLSR